MTTSLANQSRSPSAHLYPSPVALSAAWERVRQVKVPHIPDVVLALRKEMSRPEPDLRIAAALIAQDPVITGELLKAINSPLFNLRAPVMSVPQAAAMMGVKRLTNHVTAVALKRMIEGLNVRVSGVWEDILEEARVIVAISRVTPGISEDEAYLFGLLHDVGSLIFASQSGDYISQWVFHGTAEPGRLVDYERTALGIDHGTVGYLLATNWTLPEHLTLAICHHHAPEDLDADDPRVPRLIALAKLAHYLVALSRGTHEMPEMLADRDAAWRDLEISEEDWSALCERAQTGCWNQPDP